MKFLILLTVVVSVYSLDTERQWGEFKVKFHKNYLNIEEETKRFQIFQEKLRKIDEHNAKYQNGEETYFLGINQFSDLAHEEYLEMLTYNRQNLTKLPTTQVFKSPVGDLPDFVDWRTKGVVTEVKNQLDCGSCWAFSTTGGLEGQYAIKYGQVVSLSEQNLLDCSTEFGNGDCSVGGTMTRGFEYVKAYGINSDVDYPYEAVQKQCRYSAQNSILQISGYEVIPQNEDSLKSAVAVNGPISVAVDFSYAGDYAGGVFNNPACHNKPEELNHGVLVVGYGTENGIDFWIVKNSWSAGYGESGYIRMIRNANNQCGITDDASRPLVI